jgi:uncharacterized repeat protein (TIGR01451 family)
MAMLGARNGLAMFLLLLGGTAAAQETDLVVGKSGPAVAAAGSNVDYTVTLDNLGPDPGVNVVLSDPVPAGMTFVSATQSTGPVFSCATPTVGDTGTISCSLAAFPAGASASFVFTMQIPAPTPPATFFTNVASVSNDTPEVNPKSDSAVAVTQTPGLPQADLGLSKSGPGAAAPDSDITYTLSLVNGGPDTATSPSFTDVLPGDLTFVSFTQNSGQAFSCTTPAVGAGGAVTCTRADFAVGSASFTLVAHVPPGTPSGTTYTNTAVVASDADPNEENNTAVANTTIASADLSVSKTAAPTIVGGQDLSYTVTVTNNGPDVDTQVQWLDTLPAQTTMVSLTQNTGPAFTCLAPGAGGTGQVACSIATLGNGVSASFTLVVRVSLLHPGGVLSNTAQVSGDNFDPDGSDDSATATTVVTPATSDLSIGKTGAATIVGGQDLSYTVTVTNNGPDADTQVQWLDTLPAQTTMVSLAQNTGPAFTCLTPAPGGTGQVACSIAALGSGVSASFTLVVRVSVLHPGGVLNNTAQVSGVNFDPDASDDSSTATTAVTPAPVDLAASKSAAATVLAGQTLSYTLGIANPSANPALAPNLSDTLPAGTGFVSLTQTAGPTFTCTTPAAGAGGTVACNAAQLAAGASAQFTLLVSVPAATANGTLLANTVTVASTNPDAAAGNNSASTSTQVVNQADLAVSKTGPATGVAGGNLAYTIGVTNPGPLAASAVQLSDALPAGTRFVSLQQTSGPLFTCATPAVGATGTVTCTLATLAGGGTAGFTLTVSIDPGVVASTVVTNTAVVSSSTSDPGAANNTASSSATVSNFVDLSAGKTGPASVVVGSPIVYELVVSNAGTSPALNVQLTDPLPAGTTFVSLAQTAGPAFTCTTPAVGTNGTVSCTLASMSAATTARFTLTINATPSPNAITNTLTVASTSVEAGMVNNAASQATQVIAGGALPAVTIPTLQAWVLLALALLLAFGAGRAMRD